MFVICICYILILDSTGSIYLIVDAIFYVFCTCFCLKAVSDDSDGKDSTGEETDKAEGENNISVFVTYMFFSLIIFLLLLKQLLLSSLSLLLTTVTATCSTTPAYLMSPQVMMTAPTLLNRPKVTDWCAAGLSPTLVSGGWT